jgi:ABC-2 type transport system permease protein
LLSTPVTRREVVFGKFLSRTAIVAASLGIAFVVAALLSLLWFSTVRPGVFLGVAVLTTLYALAYVAVAVAISASTGSRSRAMGGALGFYFVTNLLVVFGDLSIRGLLAYLLNDILGAGVGEDPLTFLTMIMSPTQSYLASTMLVFPDAFMAEQGVNPAELSWYVQGKPGLALLLAWCVLPLLVGVWRFDRVNIG